MALAPLITRSSQFELAVLGMCKSSTKTRAAIAWGAQPQITTVSFSASFTAGQTAIIQFTIVNGSTLDVEYVVQTGDAAADVCEGFADAFNNMLGVSNYVTASSSTTTLTVRGKGVKSFTLAVDGSEDAGGTITVNANTQDAASSSNVEVGRAVIRNSAGTSSGVPYANRPVAANFTAQTATFTITSASSAIFYVYVKINGEWSTIGPVAHNTNTATTIDDIDTAVDAVMDARSDAGYNCVATNTDTTLILTVDVAGAEIQEAYMTVSGSASADVSSAVFNGSSSTYLLRKALLGFAIKDGSTHSSFSGGDGVWTGGDPMSIAYGDEVCLATTAPSAGSGFWVSVASGTDGQVYSSGAANRIWLSNDLWTDNGYANLDSLHL